MSGDGVSFSFTSWSGTDVADGGRFWAAFHVPAWEECNEVNNQEVKNARKVSAQRSSIKEGRRGAWMRGAIQVIVGRGGRMDWKEGRKQARLRQERATG